MSLTTALPQSMSKSAAVAVACGMYTALAALLFPKTFIDVLSAYPILRYYIVIPPVIILGLLGAAILHRPRSPVTFIRDKLIDRGIGALCIIGVLLLSATAFTTLKHEYALHVPFFADPFLADLDRALHFGDPWRYARAVVPALLDRTFYALYSQFWFVYVVGIVLYAAFMQNRQDRERYFTSFAASAILLSSVVRLLGSSSGPVFYDRIVGGTRFADLTAALQSSNAGPDMLLLTNYLHDSYVGQSAVLGTGISAMPSFHVALTFLNALFIASRSAFAAKFAWAYAAIVMFGSVYFGWHYALDGYVSICLVLLIWWMTGRYVRRQT